MVMARFLFLGCLLPVGSLLEYVALFGSLGSLSCDGVLSPYGSLFRLWASPVLWLAIVQWASYGFWLASHCWLSRIARLAPT
jgi:hypothetical protein